MEVGWKTLLRGPGWLDAYLQREAEGRMVVARCPPCERPVMLPLSHTLTVECMHCSSATEVAAGDVLVDALPAVRVSGSSWGGGLDLRWRPHTLVGSSDGVDCPSCSGPVPVFSGRLDCPSCQTTLYAVTSGGRRFLPGVLVTGDDEGKPVICWLPVTEAIDYYARHLELIGRSRRMTRRLMIGVVGLGAVMMALAAMLMVCLVVLVPMFGVKAVVASFVGISVVVFGGFGALLVSALAGHRAARRDLGLDAPPRFMGTAGR